MYKSWGFKVTSIQCFWTKCNLTHLSLSTVRNTKGCSVSIPSKLSHNIRASVTRRICCSWAKVKLDSNPPFSYQNLSPVIDIYIVHISLDSFYSSLLVKILTQDERLWYISQDLQKFKNSMKFQSQTQFIDLTLKVIFYSLYIVCVYVYVCRCACVCVCVCTFM